MTAKIKRTYAPEKYRAWWMEHWELFVSLNRLRYSMNDQTFYPFGVG